MRVIADKAYDSDPLRKRLRQRGIELICPHKKNRVRLATQDGRALRRYRRAGWSNAPSAGWAITVVWWCAMIARSEFIGRSFISPAS